MTAAQNKAKLNFKKAIDYRKKTGVSLKEAFAHVYGKKLTAAKKLVVKKVKKKATQLKKTAIKKTKSGIKSGLVKLSKSKYLNGTKKPTEKAILKKVHSAKTSSKTLFNKLDKLDEAQHAHMSGINRAAVEKISKINAEIEQREKVIKSIMMRRSELIARNGKEWYPKTIKQAKGYIAELKKHKTELKKFL